MLKKSFQLVVLIVAALVISAAPVVGQTSAELPVLSAVSRELKGGETHSYRVQLTAGQFLHATVEQDNIDVVTKPRERRRQRANDVGEPSGFRKRYGLGSDRQNSHRKIMSIQNGGGAPAAGRAQV